MTNTPSDYDYVIVGCGSAGAIVAAEDSGSRAVEPRGGPENTSYWSRVRFGFATSSLVLDRNVNRGKVIDLTVPLEQVAEGYRVMDQRRAIKTLLRL